MPKIKTGRFLVTVDLPWGITVENMRQYIKDAMSCEMKDYHPDDPMTQLDITTITVQKLGSEEGMHIPKETVQTLNSKIFPPSVTNI